MSRSGYTKTDILATLARGRPFSLDEVHALPKWLHPSPKRRDPLTMRDYFDHAATLYDRASSTAADPEGLAPLWAKHMRDNAALASRDITPEIEQQAAQANRKRTRPEADTDAPSLSLVGRMVSETGEWTPIYCAVRR